MGSTPAARRARTTSAATWSTCIVHIATSIGQEGDAPDTYRRIARGMDGSARSERIRPMTHREVDQRLRLRSDQLAWREVEGEIVVLDLTGGVYLSINDSGVALWMRLAEGATRTELAETLVGEYEVDGDLALRDVDAVIALL